MNHARMLFEIVYHVYVYTTITSNAPNDQHKVFLNIYSKLWAVDSWPGMYTDDNVDADGASHDCEEII